MSKTVKECKIQVCDLSFTETIQDVIDNCEKAFGLDFDFLKYENIECVESLQTAYLQGNEFSIDGAYGHEIYRTKIEIELKEEVKNDIIFYSCFDYMVKVESQIKEESQKQAGRFQDFYAENGEEGMSLYNKIFQKELSILALLRQELFCVKSFIKSI